MFTWDPYKALTNHQKHGITFEEASTVFEDPNALVIDDTKHSCIEDRMFRIGCSSQMRILTIVYTHRRINGTQTISHHLVRIISARSSSSKERAAYRETSPGFEAEFENRFLRYT